MRRGAEGAIAFGLLLALAAAAQAQPPAPRKQTPQERKRQQLLDALGLEKVDKPAPPAPAPAPGAPAPQEPEVAAPAPTDRRAPTPSAPAAPSFRRAIHPLLLQSCQVCHRTGGPATATHLLLGGDATADYAAVRPFVTPTNALASALLSKASGQTHAGGAPWPAGSEAHGRVLAWIAKGARLDGPLAPPVTTPVPGPQAPAASPHAPMPARPETPPAPEPVPPVAPGVPVPAPQAAAPQAAGDAPTGEAHAVLMATCAPCHRPGGAAAATRLVLSGDPAADEATARGLVDPTAPASSTLVTKAKGELHGGGVVLPAGDPRLAVLIAWIEKPRASAAPPAPSPSTPAAAAPPPPAPVAPATPMQGHPHAGGLRLGRDFMLNGRFDLAFERRDFSGNPFADSATSALRSYHHFLFLSRESTSDPFGLSIEILTLQFWEAHARLGGGARPWRLVVGGGKIIVPFGADPLTHQSYGGLVGFDQRILPAVWAQEGVAAHFTFERGRLVVTDDAFVVRGYALPRENAALNLQADFSPADDVRLGWGNRLGVSFFGVSAWYSAYFNPLGFGQRLFMQAADLTIWRPRQIPVLGHFSAGAGVLRADVSGRGSGLDYYDFGSYFQLRYHPTDWFYLQYRQGLRTFENRRGVIVDETRLSPEDGSTHNFAAVVRWRGLTAALAYYLMLEKAGELPNDFLRASLTYDF